MHKRRRIIEALKDQLKTIGVGGVWNQRTLPTRNVWPCITLYAEDENIEVAPSHEYPVQPRYQTRKLTVAINVWLRGDQDGEKIESDMDDWSEDVEATVINDFGVADLVHLSTEFNVAEDDPKINVITLLYAVTYYTREQNPT